MEFLSGMPDFDLDEMIDLKVDDTLNLIKDGFVFGKDDKGLNNLSNPFNPLKIDENLNGLINDYLKDLKAVVLDPLNNGVSGSIPCLPTATARF